MTLAKNLWRNAGAAEWMFSLHPWPDHPKALVEIGMGWTPSGASTRRWSAHLMYGHWRRLIGHVSPTRDTSRGRWAEITGDGLTLDLNLSHDDVDVHEAAEAFANAALHGIVEAVTFETFTPESVELGDAEDRGYEIEPQVVSPTFVHADAERYGTVDAEGSDWFSSELETSSYSTGEEIRYDMHLDDLDRVSLVRFMDWGSHPFPLLAAGSANERGVNERGAMEIMASRGFYSLALDLDEIYPREDEIGALAEPFSHLVSPIEYEEYLVWESRDPNELLVFQDLMLSGGLEGFDEIVLPKTRVGLTAGLELPVDKIFLPGQSRALLFQRDANPMATPLERIKTRLLRW